MLYLILPYLYQKWVANYSYRHYFYRKLICSEDMLQLFHSMYSIDELDEQVISLLLRINENSSFKFIRPAFLSSISLYAVLQKFIEVLLSLPYAISLLSFYLNAFHT